MKKNQAKDLNFKFQLNRSNRLVYGTISFTAVTYIWKFNYNYIDQP